MNDTTAKNVPTDDESAASKSSNLAPAPGVAPAADTSATTPTQPGNVSVATTPNLTTMNTNQNNNVPADDESSAIRSELNSGIMPLSEGSGESEGLPQPISGSYSETGNGSMSPVSGSFTIPEGGARMTLSLTVDDWGTIEVSGSGGSYSLNMGPSNSYPGGEPGQRGGHQLWSQEESFTLPQGEYQYTVTHENIGMEHEEYNVGVCNYSISFSPVGDSSSSSSSSPSSSSSSYVKEVPICDPCSCGDDNTDGDADHGPSDPAPGVPDDPCQGKTTLGENNDEGGASPASFARARAARSAANGADDAIVLPIAMRYESIWNWRASLQGSLITIVPPSGAALYFNTQANSAEAIPAGISRKRDFRVQLQKADFSPCTEGNPAFLLLVDASGQRVRFSVETGEVVATISPSGKVFTAEQRAEQVKTVFDTAGNLTACYSTTEGLMQVVPQTDGSQRLEWYAVEAVTVNADGSFSTTGEPYKTAIYLTTVNEAGVRTTTVRRQQRGLPEHTVIRSVNGNIVTITKGTGDEAIIRTYETNSLFGNMMERIESIRGINDASPVSCTREVKQFTEGGWLTISRTEAFNTPLARTTTYEYNDQFRVSKETRPGGSTVLYEYDTQGRLTKQTEPWAEGGQRITRQVYATSSGRFYDTRPIKVYTDYQTAGGSFLNIAVTNYSYEDSAQSERTTATTFAAGVSHQQVSIEETYGEAASYPYAAGKAKFSQAVNGVQTFYEYEATSEHGAAHKRTITTKANGELVAGQSRKTESFIAANDTVRFEQESVWDGENWLLLSTAAHEYDEQQRLIKTTRGNGRVSTKAWMCCGLLSETDEDGIQTDYAYNSAHQQTETTRAAVYDGDTCITPETITEYTCDAAGRILTTTRRVGAMETTESTSYDALGRVVSQTDILGRTTTTAYSEDGLTTTVTTPAGATLTTVRNTDGSVAHVSGTGQRKLHYHYDFNSNRLREIVKLADNATILSQSLTNGFGQVVVEGVASTSGALYTRSEYNTKGQLVKQYQDTGSGSTPTAATLYEYDSFGNVTKQMLALSETPTVENSPIVESAYSVESMEEGVFQVTTQTRYNAIGNPLTSTQKQLISQLSDTDESITIHIDERGLTSTQRSAYTATVKRIRTEGIPTSDITAQTVVADGFTLSQTDHAGITVTASRSYTATGMTMTQTDGRGNVTTTVMDKAGRPVSVTDAAGNTTSTSYDANHNQPTTITDAQGNTACYRYDIRGRKAAEWGTGIQPATFEYDDADRLISLTTFRANTGDISTDPGEREDGDTTTWTYHDATGLELRKTYADNTHIDKSYDAFNRLHVETLARGITKMHSYEPDRGLLLGTAYSDGATARSYQYNHLGQLVQVTDDAGTRTIGYNSYGEQETDSLLANGVTHLITETRDSYGRSTGYTYAKNGSIQQTVTTGYGTDGRIATAGFLHGGAEKQFVYSYLPGSDLLQTLTMPNNMTLTQSYEAHRDLLTGMAYKRGTSGVVERSYSYDALGRPTARTTTRQGTTKNDTFAYNNRSELTGATVGGAAYSYAYDNIGNRKSAQEASEEATSYTANALNQYTAIDDFVPTYDADGNQTLVKTSTGIWSVQYNAENRPILFTRTEADGTETQIACTYDCMGRRATKKVESNGETTLHQCYLYRGYLQVTACDLTRTGHPCLWLVLWDPTQPIAMRPLSIQKDGTWYCYGWDLTKNICEVYGSNGYVRTAYTYTPYGSATADGDVTQPLQWSSEYTDEELGLTYYNYRYYNPLAGRWSGRDPVKKDIEKMLYNAYYNSPFFIYDILGLKTNSNIKRAPFDGRHQNAKSCSNQECCVENLRRLYEWVTVSVNRRVSDFTERWKTNGTQESWEGHRKEYKEAWENAKKCVAIIKQQFTSGQCVPRPPELDLFPSWEKKVSELDDPGPFPMKKITIPQNKVSPWEQALGFALIALIAGNTGPQVAAPEEVVTVPAAFIAGFILAL